jgi:SAM-dependent methyltransferase
MDAMSAHSAAGAFDLVTGAAILHHLDHPGLGLRAASRALKPGGTALFFEPFDGYGILRLAYQRILAEDALRGGVLDPPARAGLEALAQDISARTMPDREAPAFKLMDDKWLFSPENIAIGARRNGFTRVEFVPHNDHASLYRDAAQVQLRLISGQADLPDWAMGVLDEFDAAIPLLVKRRMMLEATIVLTKGEA